MNQKKILLNRNTRHRYSKFFTAYLSLIFWAFVGFSLASSVESEDQVLSDSKSLELRKMFIRERHLESQGARYPLRIHVDFSNLAGIEEEKRILIESMIILLIFLF